MEQFPSLGWRYEIQQAIGSGGTATVYQAIDRLQGRKVAVKYARIDARTGIKQEFIRLFRLRHDCIVKVYEYHRSGDGEFFTMVLCRGGTVGEQYRSLDDEQKKALFLDVWVAMARTLSYLHQRGFIHGDLKPDNILWDGGSITLLDLGLSQRGGRYEGNVFTGTPAYAAPELVSGEEGAFVGSDIYSLGLLLFELLTGRLPDYNDRMSANSNWNTSVRELLPPDLAEILISMLRYDALDRPASASRLLQSLSETGKIATAEHIADFHFTDRGQELGDLHRTLSAGASGNVWVTGPSGCGKTRLLQEANFLAQVTGLESHFTPAVADDFSILDEIPNGAVLFIDDIMADFRERLFRAARKNSLRLVTTARELAAAPADIKTVIRLRLLKAGDYRQIIMDLFPGMVSYSRVLLAQHLDLLTGGNLIYTQLLLNHWLERSLITSRRNAWIVDWEKLYDEDSSPKTVENEFPNQWRRLDDNSHNTMLKQALHGGGQNKTVDKYWTDEKGELRCGLMAEYIINRCLSDSPAELKKMLLRIDPVPVPGRHAAWKAQASLGLDQQWATTGKALFASSLDGGNIEAAMYYGQRLADSRIVSIDERLLVVEKLMVLYDRLGRAKQAIDLLKSFDEHLTWRHYTSLAMLYIPTVENDQIIHAIESGLRKISPDDIETVRRSRIWKGWAMALKGDCPAGEATIRDELGYLRERTGTGADSAYGFYFLGEIARMQKESWQMGIELYRAAIDHGKRTLPPYALYNFYKRAGDLCRMQGKYDEAVALYNKSTTIVDDGLPFIGQFIAYGRIAECYFLCFKNALATESIEKAWSLKITAEDNQWDKYLLTLLAGLYDRDGHFQQALGTLETVARVFKEFNQMENYYTTIINIAIVEKCLGKYTRSSQRMTKVLGIARENRLEKLEKLALDNIGYLESDRQDYLKSNAYFHQSEVVCERLGLAIDFDTIFRGAVNALFLDDPLEGAHWDLLLVKYPPSTANEKRQFQILQGSKMIHAGKTAEGLALAVSVSDETKNGGQPFNSAKYCLFAADLALRTAKPESLPAIIKCLVDAAREFEQLGAQGFLVRAKEQITKASILLAQSPSVYLSHPMLNGLYQLCSSLGAHDETEAVTGKALALVMDLLGAERGGIFLKDRHGELALTAQLNLDADTSRDAYDYSRRSIASVLDGQDVIYSNDTELDEAFKSRMSVKTNRIRSLLCAPIVFREGALGAVYLDSRLRTNLFDQAQRTFLKAMVDILGAVLEGGHLLARLEEENRALKSRSSPSLDAIIWQSPEMGSMLARLQKAAPVDIAVLIEGESGTGKELLARAVHELSPRRDKPYLALDCGALAETLLESELFGHAKGAFTDAKADKPGLFEAAAGGTVFLDEIANASKAVQARLLRVLEAREVRRIGESKTRKVDVRLICAASINLEEEIKHGRFRRDLFFRIKEMKIVVPPLRERARDISLLAEHFKTVYAKQFGKTGLRFTPDARKLLVNYPWPGNVRELENAVKTAVVLSGGKAITPSCLELPEDLSAMTGHQSLKDIMNRQEKAAIEKALQQNGFNVTATAKILKLTRQGLQKKMKQLGIS